MKCYPILSFILRSYFIRSIAITIDVGKPFCLNIDPLHIFREFAKEKERVESRAGFMALKEQQKLDKELTGYVEWICRAGEMLTNEASSFSVDNLDMFTYDSPEDQTTKLHLGTTVPKSCSR